VRQAARQLKQRLLFQRFTETPDCNNQIGTLDAKGHSDLDYRFGRGPFQNPIAAKIAKSSAEFNRQETALINYCKESASVFVTEENRAILEQYLAEKKRQNSKLGQLYRDRQFSVDDLILRLMGKRYKEIYFDGRVIVPRSDGDPLDRMLKQSNFYKRGLNKSGEVGRTEILDVIGTNQDQFEVYKEYLTLEESVLSALILPQTVSLVIGNGNRNAEGVINYRSEYADSIDIATFSYPAAAEFRGGVSAHYDMSFCCIPLNPTPEFIDRRKNLLQNQPLLNAGAQIYGPRTALSFSNIGEAQKSREFTELSGFLLHTEAYKSRTKNTLRQVLLAADQQMAEFGLGEVCNLKGLGLGAFAFSGEEGKMEPLYLESLNEVLNDPTFLLHHIKQINLVNLPSMRAEIKRGRNKEDTQYTVVQHPKCLVTRSGMNPTSTKIKFSKGEIGGTVFCGDSGSEVGNEGNIGLARSSSDDPATQYSLWDPTILDSRANLRLQTPGCIKRLGNVREAEARREAASPDAPLARLRAAPVRRVLSAEENTAQDLAGEIIAAQAKEFGTEKFLYPLDKRIEIPSGRFSLPKGKQWKDMSVAQKQEYKNKIGSGSEHFDWWIFPSSSKLNPEWKVAQSVNKYNSPQDVAIGKEVFAILRQDPNFCKNFYASMELYLYSHEGVEFDPKANKLFFTKSGIFVPHPVRLDKMIESLCGMIGDNNGPPLSCFADQEKQNDFLLVVNEFLGKIDRRNFESNDYNAEFYNKFYGICNKINSARAIASQPQFARRAQEPQFQHLAPQRQRAELSSTAQVVAVSGKMALDAASPFSRPSMLSKEMEFKGYPPIGAVKTLPMQQRDQLAKKLDQRFRQESLAGQNGFSVKQNGNFVDIVPNVFFDPELENLRDNVKVYFDEKEIQRLISDYPGLARNNITAAQIVDDLQKIKAGFRASIDSDDYKSLVRRCAPYILSRFEARQSFSLNQSGMALLPEADLRKKARPFYNNYLPDLSRPGTEDSLEFCRGARFITNEKGLFERYKSAIKLQLIAAADNEEGVFITEPEAFLKSLNDGRGGTSNERQKAKGIFLNAAVAALQEFNANPALSSKLGQVFIQSSVAYRNFYHAWDHLEKEITGINNIAISVTMGVDSVMPQIKGNGEKVAQMLMGNNRKPIGNGAFAENTAANAAEENLVRQCPEILCVLDPKYNRKLSDRQWQGSHFHSAESVKAKIETAHHKHVAASAQQAARHPQPLPAVAAVAQRVEAFQNPQPPMSAKAVPDDRLQNAVVSEPNYSPPAMSPSDRFLKFMYGGGEIPTVDRENFLANPPETSPLYYLKKGQGFLVRRNRTIVFTVNVTEEEKRSGQVLVYGDQFAEDEIFSIGQGRSKIDLIPATIFTDEAGKFLDRPFEMVSLSFAYRDYRIDSEPLSEAMKRCNCQSIAELEAKHRPEDCGYIIQGTRLIHLGDWNRDLNSLTPEAFEALKKSIYLNINAVCAESEKQKKPLPFILECPSVEGLTDQQKQRVADSIKYAFNQVLLEPGVSDAVARNISEVIAVGRNFWDSSQGHKIKLGEASPIQVSEVDVDIFDIARKVSERGGKCPVPTNKNAVDERLVRMTGNTASPHIYIQKDQLLQARAPQARLAPEALQAPKVATVDPNYSTRSSVGGAFSNQQLKPRFTIEGKLRINEFSNSDYEVWRNPSENNLQYVRLRAPGLRTLVTQYQAKFPERSIDIEVLVGKVSSEKAASNQDSAFALDPQHFEKRKSEIIRKFKEDSESLAPGASKGFLISFQNADDFLMHTIPYFITKDNRGNVTLVNFENHFSLTDQDVGPGVKIKNIDQKKPYGCDANGTQVDAHSCSVFAINTLKHCFTDDGFIDHVQGASQTVTLPKMVLGQTKVHKADLPQEKKEKYFEGEVNRKAIYKGHDYAEKINPDHKSCLNAETLNLVEAISAKRKLSSSTASQPLIKRAAVNTVQSQSPILQQPQIVNPATEPKSPWMEIFERRLLKEQKDGFWSKKSPEQKAKQMEVLHAHGTKAKDRVEAAQHDAMKYYLGVEARIPSTSVKALKVGRLHSDLSASPGVGSSSARHH